MLPTTRILRDAAGCEPALSAGNSRRRFRKKDEPGKRGGKGGLPLRSDRRRKGWMLYAPMAFMPPLASAAPLSGLGLLVAGAGVDRLRRPAPEA